MNSDPTDQRLHDYFLRRAIELLEKAKAAEQEGDVVRQMDLEARVAQYWAIARGLR
jgi:hypothetical protein